MTRLKILVFVTVCAAAFASSAAESDHETAAYVGVAACLECHNVREGTLEGVSWTGTMHARSYLALETGYEAMVPPEAKALVPLGAGRQIKEEAEKRLVETDCVSCHGGVEAGAGHELLESYHVEDGVQCEACHGPGSLHVAARRGGVVSTHELSVDPGLKAELCDRCHREKPSHQVLDRKPFDADRAWKHVAHRFPAGDSGG